VIAWPPSALVLTAGSGTRLQPLTYVRAKPAVPVAGTPLVVWILRRLVEAGVRNAVLNLHHRPETIAGVVGEGRDLGLSVRYSWEQPILGSAGGPRRSSMSTAG
jgi:NDP-sugar pyrophosphorylase family protein